MMLSAAKNKRTDFVLRVRRKVKTLEVICNDPEKQEYGRLAETWQEYENSQQVVLDLITENEVEAEPVTFIEMEDTYEATVDKANGIIKGKTTKHKAMLDSLLDPNAQEPLVKEIRLE